MANMKYFAERSGQVLSFDRASYRGNVPYGYIAGENVWVKCDRVIEYKANASKHECDDRCMNATGRSMKCECACGGRNHGRGAFVCLEAA